LIIYQISGVSLYAGQPFIIELPCSPSMKCPKCGYENLPDSRYCGNCTRTLGPKAFWSFHDQAYWNLSEEEKVRRIKYWVLPSLIIGSILLTILLLFYLTGHQ
jgi:uncharacterized membrane protein YvbJ